MVLTHPALKRISMFGLHFIPLGLCSAAACWLLGIADLPPGAALTAASAVAVVLAPLFFDASATLPETLIWNLAAAALGPAVALAWKSALPHALASTFMINF